MCVRARLQPCRKTRSRNTASAAEGGSPRLLVHPACPEPKRGEPRRVGGAALSSAMCALRMPLRSAAIRPARKTGFSPGFFRRWELQFIPLAPIFEGSLEGLPRKVCFCAGLQLVLRQRRAPEESFRGSNLWFILSREGLPLRNCFVSGHGFSRAARRRPTPPCHSERSDPAFSCARFFVRRVAKRGPPPHRLAPFCER